MKPLVLGLGNELLGDDGIGVLAARRMAEELGGRAEVVESGLSGVALLDILTGHRKAIIIDAIQTARVPPGTIVELDPGELRAILNPSPHYTGLPEMMTLARELNLEFPDEIRILAVEGQDIHTLGAPLSRPVAEALDKLAQMVETYLKQWETTARREQAACTSCA